MTLPRILKPVERVHDSILSGEMWIGELVHGMIHPLSSTPYSHIVHCTRPSEANSRVNGNGSSCISKACPGDAPSRAP